MSVAVISAALFPRLRDEPADRGPRLALRLSAGRLDLDDSAADVLDSGAVDTTTALRVLAESGMTSGQAAWARATKRATAGSGSRGGTGYSHSP